MESFDGIEPNDVSYTSVVVGWTNSEDPDAAIKAEKILWRMERLYQSGRELVKPNVITFSAVINAYSKRGDAKKAERLLQKMQQNYEKDMDLCMKPNVFTVSSF